MKLIAIALLSLMLVAFTPIAMTVSAQSAADQKLQQIKQKATTELDRRIAQLTATQKKLDATVVIKNTTDKAVVLPAEAKTKSEQLVQKYIAQLTQFKQKVQSLTSVVEAQKLAVAIDSQYGLDKAVNAQGAVTKVVETMTGTYDNLKTMSNDLQGQITKLKDCADNSSAAGCGKVGTGAEAKATELQNRLDAATQQMNSVQSVVGAVVALQSDNVATLSTVTAKLGDLSKLVDVTSNGELKSLESLQKSSTAVTSQLTIGYTVAASVQYLLTSISDVTTTFDF